jgi:hypothetical protein
MCSGRGRKDKTRTNHGRSLSSWYVICPKALSQSRRVLPGERMFDERYQFIEPRTDGPSVRFRDRRSGSGGRVVRINTCEITELQRQGLFPIGQTLGLDRSTIRCQTLGDYAPAQIHPVSDHAPREGGPFQPGPLVLV